MLVSVEKKDGIVTLTMNESARINMFSQPLAHALVKKLEDIWFERAVKVVILRFVGSNFTTGGDGKGLKRRENYLRQRAESITDPRKNKLYLNRIIMMISNMDKPVIARLEGTVDGYGLSLAMACDFSIAEDTCEMVFTSPETGMAHYMGFSFLMTPRAGMPRAKELLMMGCPISGRQAADWGLITDAVPAANLEERVMVLAEDLVSGPLRTYAEIKATLNRVMYQGLDEAMTADG